MSYIKEKINVYILDPKVDIFPSRNYLILLYDMKMGRKMTDPKIQM